MAADVGAMSQAVEPSGSAPAPSRLYYLDWARAIIIGMVFVGHVMLPFSGVPWLITADARIRFGGLILAIGNQFAMPVMFLIAGASTYFSLRKRSSGRFARERLLRLGLPYIVFTLLLSPVQAYYAALDAGSYSGPFFPDFLPQFFNLDGFGGRDLSFLGHYGYHLWFLGFLLFFCLVSLPLIGYLKGISGQRLTDRLAHLAERRGGLLLLFLPFALLQLVMMWFWRGFQGWANTAFWGSFFLLGYVLYSNPRFLAALRRDWRIWAGAALVTLLVLAVLAVLGLLGLSRLVDAARDNPEAARRVLAEPGAAIEKAGLVVPLLLGYVGVLTAYNYNAWALTLLVMALGMARFDFDHRNLKVAGPFSMPFYIFHHPFVVIFGYYIVRLGIGAFSQMLLLGVIAFVATIALVALLIAPWNPLRALFGMRKPSARSRTSTDERSGLT